MLTKVLMTTLVLAIALGASIGGGPQQMAHSAEGYIGGGIMECVNVVPCYPGCEGYDPNYAMCWPIANSQYSCGEVLFLYPCGLEPDCDYQRWATGTGCP